MKILISKKEWDSLAKSSSVDYSKYLAYTPKDSGGEYYCLYIQEGIAPPLKGEVINVKGEKVVVFTCSSPLDMAKGRGGPIANFMRRDGIGYLVNCLPIGHERLSQNEIMITASNLDNVLKDKNGEPIVFYHGTRGESFSEFDTEKSGYNYGKGAYFTPDPNRASGYAQGEWYREEDDYDSGARVYPVYINLSNPFITNSDAGVSDIGYKERSKPENDGKWNNNLGNAEIGNQILRDRGHDGIIKSWTWNANDPLEVVVFHPSSIISLYS